MTIFEPAPPRKPMTNPNPVAPKTDTPATQIPDWVRCENCGHEKIRHDPKCEASQMTYPTSWRAEIVNCECKEFRIPKFIANLESTLAAERASRKTERDELLDIAQGVVDEYSPCVFDENRPKLKYCFTHSTKHCSAKKTYEMAQAALSKSSVSPEQAEETK